MAVIVECLTDNRNRTGADIRSIFSKNGGSMAEPGAVAWQFERKGALVVPHGPKVSEDDLMLVAAEAGADDVRDNGEGWDVLTPPGELAAVRAAVESQGLGSLLRRAGHGARRSRCRSRARTTPARSCVWSTCLTSTTTCRACGPISTSRTR